MPFMKGNTYGRGRPKGSKNTAPVIRDRLCRILLRRIVRDKDLESVSTSELIRFLSSVLPRDVSLTREDRNIVYVSNVPRPEIDNRQEDTGLQEWKSVS